MDVSASVQRVRDIKSEFEARRVDDVAAAGVESEVVSVAVWLRERMRECDSDRWDDARASFRLNDNPSPCR